METQLTSLERRIDDLLASVDLPSESEPIPKEEEGKAAAAAAAAGSSAVAAAEEQEHEARGEKGKTSW